MELTTLLFEDTGEFLRIPEGANPDGAHHFEERPPLSEQEASVLRNALKKRYFEGIKALEDLLGEQVDDWRELCCALIWECECARMARGFFLTAEDAIELRRNQLSDLPEIRRRAATLASEIDLNGRLLTKHLRKGFRDAGFQVNAERPDENVVQQTVQLLTGFANSIKLDDQPRNVFGQSQHERTQYYAFRYARVRPPNVQPPLIDTVLQFGLTLLCRKWTSEETTDLYASEPMPKVGQPLTKVCLEFSVAAFEGTSVANNHESPLTEEMVRQRMRNLTQQHPDLEYQCGSFGWHVPPPNRLFDPT
ncbi:MAG: hypothetical protein ABJL64_20085 [Rhizobiaceae bacterium]